MFQSQILEEKQKAAKIWKSNDAKLIEIQFARRENFRF